MKKILAFFIAVMLLFAVSCVPNGTESGETTANSPDMTTPTETESSTKVPESEALGSDETTNEDEKNENSGFAIESDTDDRKWSEPHIPR